MAFDEFPFVSLDRLCLNSVVAPFLSTRARYWLVTRNCYAFGTQSPGAERVYLAAALQAVEMPSTRARPVWILSTQREAVALNGCRWKGSRAWPLCKYSFWLAGLFVQAAWVGCDALAVRSRQLGLKLQFAAAFLAKLSRQCLLTGGWGYKHLAMPPLLTLVGAAGRIAQGRRPKRPNKQVELRQLRPLWDCSQASTANGLKLLPGAGACS